MKNPSDNIIDKLLSIIPGEYCARTSPLNETEFTIEDGIDDSILRAWIDLAVSESCSVIISSDVQKEKNMLIQHDAIIITSNNGADFLECIKTAHEIFEWHSVSQPSEVETNGFRTFMIFPDGSGEGYEKSMYYNASRLIFLKQIKDQKLDVCVCCVSYGQQGYMTAEMFTQTKDYVNESLLRKFEISDKGDSSLYPTPTIHFTIGLNVTQDETQGENNESRDRQN